MSARVMASNIRASLQYDENDRSHDQMPLDKVELMFQRPRACGSKNLIQRVIPIQAQEDMMSARVMASNIRPKLHILLRWLFDHISGLMCSFEMGSLWT